MDPPQSVAVVEQTTGAVEVCAVIGGAELERDVIVMLETTQLTATGVTDAIFLMHETLSFASCSI